MNKNNARQTKDKNTHRRFLLNLQVCCSMVSRHKAPALFLSHANV